MISPMISLVPTSWLRRVCGAPRSAVAASKAPKEGQMPVTPPPAAAKPPPAAGAASAGNDKEAQAWIDAWKKRNGK